MLGHDVGICTVILWVFVFEKVHHVVDDTVLIAPIFQNLAYLRRLVQSDILGPPTETGCYLCERSIELVLVRGTSSWHVEHVGEAAVFVPLKRIGNCGQSLVVKLKKLVSSSIGGVTLISHGHSILSFLSLGRALRLLFILLLH